jgi:DNA-binding ferritin-like protein
MSKQAAGKFIGVLFLSRTVAHQLHLKTDSFSQHSALNTFYDEIVDHADGIAEQWQGEQEELLDIPTLAAKDATDPLKYMKETLKWIEGNRYEAFEKTDTSIQNDIDNVVKLFRSTIYKLRFLK